MQSYSNFPTHVGLAALMGAALLTIFFTMLAFYVLLVQIELQSTLSFADSVDEVGLEENGDQGETAAKGKPMDGKENGSEPSDKESSVSRRMHLPRFRRGVLAAVVGIVTFMTYLLLALSNANVVLCWIGMFTMLGLLLRQSIFDEVRRERLDRLSGIFSCVLILAMALNLAVYANRQHAQGDIYEGKARIVGYDFGSYTQDKDDKILRTDLEVEWGGWWGCPNLPEDMTCHGLVAGALCEVKEDDSGNRKRHLLSPKQKFRLSRSSSYRKLDGGASDNSNQNVTINKDSSGASNQTDYAAANAELEKENEELEAENEQLEAENEELQSEVDEYQEYASEEEDMVEELYDEEEEIYSFDDDMYYDEYWGQTSWDDVWGEYACEDLFDSDIGGQTYDQNDPPGSDEWPFVNIYGNCDTCDAYIVDYYSTEHFQSILSYKKAGLRYGIMAGLALITTGFLIARHKTNGKDKLVAGKEIELLPASSAISLA